MAKPERGLPRNFVLNVPEGPVQVGDYLEENVAPSTPNPPPPVAPPTPLPSNPIYSAPPVAESDRSQPPSPRTSPPRKQFNMTPETLRMVDDLLRHIRLHSHERDVRASELIHALVLALHEAMPYLDLSRVPPRGKWGSPSAAHLPIALKEAFQRALARFPAAYK